MTFCSSVDLRPSEALRRLSQIGTNVRYEAFVERGGFHDLYYKLKTPRELDEENFKKKKQEGKSVTKSSDSQPIDKYSLYKTKKVYQRRLACDGFYRLGELSFCFRDTANAHFRYNLPLPQVKTGKFPDFQL